MDPTQFRLDFPEFANTTTYPDTTIQYWINVATLLLNPLKWGTMLNTGIELYVAHNLVLESQAAASAAVGGIPGVSNGILSSKSVGKVSVSYDAALAAYKDAAGPFNLTNYGTRYRQLANMFGAGGFQI